MYFVGSESFCNILLCLLDLTQLCSFVLMNDLCIMLVINKSLVSHNMLLHLSIDLIQTRTLSGYVLHEESEKICNKTIKV